MSETPSGLAALLKILRYLEDTERKDYESRSARDRKGHIYEAVLIVRKWMEGNMAPTDQDKRDAEKHRLRQEKKMSMTGRLFRTDRARQPGAPEKRKSNGN